MTIAAYRRMEVGEILNLFEPSIRCGRKAELRGAEGFMTLAFEPRQVENRLFPAPMLDYGLKNALLMVAMGRKSSSGLSGNGIKPKCL